MKKRLQAHLESKLDQFRIGDRFAKSILNRQKPKLHDSASFSVGEKSIGGTFQSAKSAHSFAAEQRQLDLRLCEQTAAPQLSSAFRAGLQGRIKREERERWPVTRCGQGEALLPRTLGAGSARHLNSVLHAFLGLERIRARNARRAS